MPWAGQIGESWQGPESQRVSWEAFLPLLLLLRREGRRERRTWLRAVLLSLSQGHGEAVLVPLGMCSEQGHDADKRTAEPV